MASKIDVSVIIPNFNYSRYVEQCINSVLESNFDLSKLEIIFVDDASTDDSVSIVTKIKEYAKVPVQLIKNKVNSGLAKTRNKGIKHARGEYLFFLDSDNYILSNCIQKHYDCLSKTNEYAACYAPVQKFDNDTNSFLSIFSNEEYNLDKLIHGNYIDAMAMIKKDELIKVGEYDESMPHNGWEDYELWLRMGHNNRKTCFIDGEALSMYRVHIDSMINSITKINSDELRLYISKKYNLSNDLSNGIIKPIKETKIQIYLGNDENGFSEEHSFHSNIILDTPQNIEFTIDSKYKALKYIRFDIGEELGFIAIDSINITNTNREILWDFSTNQIISKNNFLFIESGEYFQGKIIQLSTNNDPQFTIEIPSTVVKFLSNGIIVRISLSPIGNEIWELLNRTIVKPLSFLSKRDLEKLKSEINSVEVERNLLSKKIESSEALIQNHQNDIDQLLKENKSKDLFIAELNNNNTILSKELNEKNSIINKLITEENTAQSLISELSSKIISIENKFSIFLEQDIKETEIFIRTNGLLEKELNEKNGVINKLIEEKKNIEKLISELTNALKSNTDFIKIIDVNQSQILRLNNSIEQLMSKIEALEITNKNIEILHKAEQEENIINKNNISSQKELLEQYQIFYEKKSLFKVILFRIARKKISL